MLKDVDRRRTETRLSSSPPITDIRTLSVLSLFRILLVNITVGNLSQKHSFANDLLKVVTKLTN